MSLSPNFNFQEVPFSGEEPLGIITINVGFLTSAVSGVALYPGFRPFNFDLKRPVDTAAIVDGWEVAGFPLQFNPAARHEVPGFAFPELPPGLSIEMLLTQFLADLRTIFENALRDVELWTTVQEQAQVIFIHPIVWDARMDLIRGCIENAGWLNDGKRKLMFMSEADSSVAQISHDYQLWSKPLPKHFVVINECGSSTVTVTCFETDATNPCNSKLRGTSQTCFSGFALAYDAARRMPIIKRSGTQYNMSLDKRRITEWKGYGGEGDIIVFESQIKSYRAASTGQLAEMLAKTLRPIQSDHCIFFGGNYIGTKEVQQVVYSLLSVQGAGAGPFLLPPQHFLRLNAMCFRYNFGAVYSFLSREGLLKSLPHRLTDSLKWSSIEVGDYWCFQFTRDGSPPDLTSSGVARSLSANLQPPSPDIVSHIDNIRESASKYYGQMRPWKTAETSIGFLTPIVDDMKGCFTSYTSFLNESLDASKSGHSVGEECETLCNKLRSGISAEEFQQEVHKLQALTKVAVEDATKMAESIRSLRQRVIKDKGRFSQDGP